MSEEIGHFCGIALIRLKSLLHTTLKNMALHFGDLISFSINGKSSIIEDRMVRVGSMKLNVDAGQAFMFRERSTSSKALAKIFEQQNKTLNKLFKKGLAFHEFQKPSRITSIMGGTSSWAPEIWNIRFLWIHDMPPLF